MQKSIKIILSLAVILMFVLVVVNSVSAVVSAPDSASGGGANVAAKYSWGDCNYSIKSLDKLGFFEKRFCIWKEGAPALNDEAKKSLVGETLKYLVLILVIILAYSSFSSVEFPSNIVLRLVISAVVGFLATFLITTAELITMLFSYNALAVTFTVFLPILILAFFTMVVSSKANPIGIYIQKIVWVIYSVYLFIKCYTLWIIPTVVSKVELVADKGVYWYDTAGTKMTEALPWYVQAVWPTGEPAQEYAAAQSILNSGQDSTMLIVLIITAVMIFVIMVLGNKYVDRWFEHQKLEAEKEAFKMKTQRSSEKMDIDAKALQGSKQI